MDGQDNVKSAGPSGNPGMLQSQAGNSGKTGSPPSLMVRLWGKIKSATEALEGHKVTLKALDGTERSEITDAQGSAMFENLNPGQYLAVPASHAKYGDHPGSPVVVQPSGTTQHDVTMTGSSGTKTTITGSLSVLSSSGAVVPTNFSGSTVTATPADSSVPAPSKFTVAADNAIKIDVPSGGWYGVQVTLAPALSELVPDYITPVWVSVLTGQTSAPVNLSYQAQTASLILSAALGSAGTTIPLANCIFRIYSGLTVQGQPTSEIAAKNLDTVIVTDLPEGQYTVVCMPPSTAGQTILPSALGSDQFSVYLSVGGPPLKNQFLFKTQSARVTGLVVDENGTGAPSVAMLLVPSNGTGNPQTQATDPDGVYEFSNVSIGQYQLGLAQDEVVINGRVFVPADPNQALLAISVASTDIVQAPVYKLAEDIHRISGFVKDETGRKLPGVDVQIQNLSGTTKTVVTSNSNGYYEWIAPFPGLYRLRLSDEQWDTVSVGAPVQKDLVRFTSGGGTGSSSGAGGGKKNGSSESIIDLTAYPILTEQIGTSGGTITPAGGGGAASGASLGQTVDQTLRQLLGWKPRSDDPKGFLGALTQSFNLKDVEGHVVATWVPRTYAVQTDLSGGITGAQASLLTRAQEAIDRSQSLLDGLYPLRPDPDAEFIAAIKAVVKNQFTSLVNELGMLGGPRPARVDQIFQLLGGPAPFGAPSVETDPDKITGELGRLRAQLGLRTAPVPGGENGGYAINVTDEEDQTNFRVMVDYFTSLRISWEVNKQFFIINSGQQPFLGTQLVLISRGLSVVSEAVDEVRSTTDSVFIGPSERQTLELDLTDENGSIVPMFLEDLLTWIQSFATQEGPELVQDGGKFALGTGGAFGQIATKLTSLAKSAATANSTSLPPGYKTPRVQRALGELAGRLGELVSLAAQFQQPFGLN